MFIRHQRNTFDLNQEPLPGFVQQAFSFWDGNSYFHLADPLECDRKRKLILLNSIVACTELCIKYVLFNGKWDFESHKLYAFFCFSSWVHASDCVS